MGYKFEDLAEEYAGLIDTMEILPKYLGSVNVAARKVIANKERYKKVSKLAGGSVPWQLIGIAHHLESGGDFTAHLHNGDPLAKRTVQVPAGRPLKGKPPFTWEESAVDAIQQKNLHLIEDWSPTRVAYELERYNGFGYRGHHINSPYLWSMTNHYSKGKYVSDGVWNAEATSKQTGGMAVLERITALDIAPQMIVDGSRKLTMLRRIKAAIATTFGGFWSADYLNVAPTYIEKIKELGLSHGLLLAAGGAAAAWAVFSIIEAYTVQDYKEARYVPSGRPENPVDKEGLL